MKPAKKILIVRFSSIGDIVLTSPIIRCIKQQLAAEVHFLTKQSFEPLLKHNPYVDKLWLLEGSFGALIKDLRKEKFDVLVDLHKNLRSFRLSLSLNIKSYRFNKLNFSKWLMVKLKINRLPKIHLVDRYFIGLRSLGIKNDGEGLDFFIPPSEELDIAAHFKGIKNYIAIVIGATYFTKRIPKEKLIAICQKIKQPIILLGGPAETDLGASIVAASSNTQIFNAAGAFSLLGSASIIRQAQQVITSDTGLMHVAAAYQKPITSVWGNTIPDFGMYPYYKKGLSLNQSIEIKDLACRPCSKIGFAKCPKGHFACMNRLEIEAFVKKIPKKDG